MFSLTFDDLIDLWKENQFLIPEEGLLFFGLRGCQPADMEDGHNFQDSHYLMLADVNYRNPRCTLGQVNLDDRTFSIFSGSTVPNIKNIKKAQKRGGKGANQLMTGYHENYKKGWHRSSSIYGHRAFRMDSPLPIRRSYDDLDYDELDRVEYMVPYDNLHAAWSMGSDSRYSSAGCQVVVGFPQCKHRNGEQNSGSWAVFYDNAYNANQEEFDYILLNGRDALSASNKNPPTRLRYGSNGSLVKELQHKLNEKELYQGAIDGKLGELTLYALINFQKTEYGKSSADGILGPITAKSLGITLNHS